MLQPYALVSLTEFKSTTGFSGDAKDEVIERAINAASRIIEIDADRRLRYRAPEEVEGAANIVASVALANGPQTVAAQPGDGGRTLIVSVADTDRSVKAGTVTVTGTVGGVAGSTELFYLSDGRRLHGRKFFTAISGISVASLAGASAADFLTIGTSEGMVEYHTPSRSNPARLVLLERPVYQIAAIHEDASRSYASASELELATDYEISKDGTITRVSSSLPYCWCAGYRAVKVRYSAGYGGIATVPPTLKDVCLRLAIAKYQEIENKTINVQTTSDQLGNFTRFGDAQLSDSMRNDLAEYRSVLFTTTAERDFDQEAA